MRIGKVIGKVVLNRKLAEVPAGTYLLADTCNRGTLAGRNAGNHEDLVVYDTLGAREGDHIGMVEGREACNAFHPAKVPFDAYCSAILDTIEFKPVLPVE
jgi:microcompartment protein CcmK/EutM